LQASCPLAGGALDEGSTCGVVSGGCLAIALGHLGGSDKDDADKGEALYDRMREYTSWFEERFGSTLCRERFGELDKPTLSGLMKCLVHTGSAASHLVGMVDEPVEESGGLGGTDESPSEDGGYCAAEVMRGIREATGHGSHFLERLSAAFDGGIGLSGGLCGALAGALMPIGMIWGLQPRAAGLVETMRFTTEGHKDLSSDSEKPGMWTVGNPLVREFRRKFGSLECRDIVGRSFQSGRELAEFMPGIKEWCRDQAAERISANTTRSG
jgi:C_GCAxxG_C_C family probable redox protein